MDLKNREVRLLNSYGLGPVTVSWKLDSETQCYIKDGQLLNAL
jgi:hypothetical protein